MLGPKVNASQVSVHAPELLQISIERLWLDVTEPLDQLVALKLLELLRGTVEVTYLLGFQDGQRSEEV